jgi:ArsR family transcriptional regulator
MTPMFLIDNRNYFHYSRIMEIHEATEAFSSLSQETRLKVFKLLIEFGRDGTVPGVLVEKLKIPNNTLSFHLSHMERASLVTSEKNGRSITYFANTNLINSLIDFLQENCCGREEKSKNKNPKERKC